MIPARPYLERVAMYPRYGREGMTNQVRDIVEHIKREEPDAWALSEPGCARMMVSAHDTGKEERRRRPTMHPFTPV